jgi:hypothetical protein
MTRYTPLWEQAGSYAASVDRHLISSLWPNPASSGCALTAVAGTMSVNVAPGTVAAPSQNATGSTLCVSDAVETVVIAAAPGSGQNRIDLIICRPRGTDLDGGASNDFIFDTVAGVPAASPVAPALPAGTVLLGQVLVPGGSAAVTQGNITDARPAQQLAVPIPQPVGTWQAPAYTNGWADLAGSPGGYKLVGTRVYLRGIIAGGTQNTAAFTLPVGYRPVNTARFPAYLNNGGTIVVAATIVANTGTVTISGTGNTQWGLDGVSFDTV